MLADLFRDVEFGIGQNLFVDFQSKDKVKTMAGERELTTGLLSKDSSFRLIVTGHIGVKEIERLIAKPLTAPS